MGKGQAIIVIAILAWPLFKVLFYFGTRWQVDAPLQAFDFAAFLIGAFLSFCIWLIYSRFLRPKKTLRKEQ